MAYARQLLRWLPTFRRGRHLLEELLDASTESATLQIEPRFRYRHQHGLQLVERGAVGNGLPAGREGEPGEALPPLCQGIPAVSGEAATQVRRRACARLTDVDEIKVGSVQGIDRSTAGHVDWVISARLRRYAHHRAGDPALAPVHVIPMPVKAICVDESCHSDEPSLQRDFVHA